MQGKHFKIRSTKNMEVHRHYTICNTMRPQMYNSLLACLKEQQDAHIDKELMSEVDSNTMTFTIKNYD